MSKRQEFEKSGRFNEFKLNLLSASINLGNFDCGITEYNEYLVKDSLCSMNDHIALTWLLTERSTEKIVAYMSLIMDSIKLSFTEKELHNLNYPFKTIPSMKIAKLAVDCSFSQRYKGIGTFMINSAERLAWSCNINFCACRFLTVDADIEHDAGVLAFYKKMVSFQIPNFSTRTEKL
ncbi:MAG: hypothetical protein LBU88_09305 [Treponema sp.]|jgi:hypothetical protein|nr:hypothetical protein [Treponema sp.]